MEVARSAATEAASLAARASLHEAMQNLPQQPEARAQSQAIQRDLLDIRAEQEAASKRGHATLNAVHGTLEKIVDRLATLETSRPEVHGPSLEDTRNIAMEAARNAARETFQEIRDQSPAASDNQDSDYIKRDLADLRHAQEEAGERTHSTLKAVHQTLERVVDRLATLEDEKTATPFAALQAHNHGAAQGQPEVSDRSHAAPVFAPAPRRFDMSVDVETLRPRASPRSPEPAPAAAGRRQSQTAPAAPGAGLQDADGLEMLLEPGSGLPPHRGAGPTIQAANKARLASETVQSNSVTASAGETVGGQPNSFSAAARRAAQAAAAEVTAERQSPTPRIDRVADTSSVSNFPPANSAGVLASATTFMRVRKKPILIGLTGLVVVLGAAMISRTFIAGPAYVQKVEIVPQDYGNTNVTAAVADPVAPVAAVAATLSPAAPNSVAEVPAAPAADAPVPLVRMLSPRVGRQATLPPGTIAGPSGTAGPIAMAIPGDVASHGLPKARPQVATAVPILPIAPQAAIGAVPAPSGVDQNPVGSIDGKPNAAALPTPTGVSTLLRTAALAGSAAAQYEIGMRYAEGRGVTRDLKIAAQWFEQSANIGLAPAQYRIGSLYEKGLGVAKDNAAAKNWYQKAAEGGNIRAMHNLAVLTAEGTDGKPDYANAAQWFKKAAEHGVRDSQYNLAILYARGLGIEQNLAQSYIWFAVAAALGDEDASKKRDEVAGKLDAKALAAARAGVEAFHPMVPNVASNDVPPPAGGWDGTPQKTELGVKMPNKV